MKQTKFIGILLVVVVILGGCKTETQLKRDIDRNWEISKLNFAHFQDDLSIEGRAFEQTQAGNFLMAKDNTGTFRIDYDERGVLLDDPKIISRWETTDTSLFIRFNNSGTEEQWEFKILQSEKRFQRWIRYEPSQESRERNEWTFELNPLKN